LVRDRNAASPDLAIKLLTQIAPLKPKGFTLARAISKT